MLNGIIQFAGNLKVRNTIQLHWMPLWFKSSLNFEYRKKWKELGYQLVGDILNREGELLSLEDMRKRNLKINFLDYFEIKNIFFEIQDAMGNRAPIYGPYIPRILFEIGLYI